MTARLSVVVSQGQSQNPAKRALEEDIVTGLLLEPGVDVTVVPHLYDLKPDSTGMLALQGIPGTLVVISWLYERAARWILDRNRVNGQVGVSELATIPPEDEDEFEDNEVDEDEADASDEKVRVQDQRDVPKRHIYCLELSVIRNVEEVLGEIRRIAKEQSTPVVELTSWVGGSPSEAALKRFESPTNDTALGAGSGPGNGSLDSSDHEPIRIVESADRRWYPVIDFSRCTNCMECIDFCLFGVYGVDAAETILVEQPDNCRKGCPACSRVCPENAIIFPQHKTPAIAGAPVVDTGGFKIDLSKLFGAPDAVNTAAQERDEQLVLAGREAVGMEVGIPKRQTQRASEDRDDLDDLIDCLDDLDL